MIAGSCPHVHLAEVLKLSISCLDYMPSYLSGTRCPVASLTKKCAIGSDFNILSGEDRFQVWLPRQTHVHECTCPTMAA